MNKYGSLESLKVEKLGFKKTKNFEKLGDIEKMCISLGVPLKNVKVDANESFAFTKIKHHYFQGKNLKLIRKVTPKEQSKWYTKILENKKKILEQPSFLVMGGRPTGDVIEQMAFNIIRRIVDDGRLQYKMTILNLARFKRSQTLNEPDLLLLHNITPESSPARIELTRDLLTCFCNSFRIVVVAGADPVQFATTRLRMLPDIVLYTENVDPIEVREN